MSDALIQIESPEPPPRRFALFALGFRPFFLGAAVHGAVAMVAWGLAYRGQAMHDANGFGAPVWWHAHSMVFGYAMAAVAGFLLTAVRNWTQRPTTSPPVLAALFTAWALPRVLPFLGAPLWISAVLDVGFGLALTVLIAVPLARAGRRRDLSIFPPKLLTLAIANGLVYAAVLGYADTLRVGLYLGLYLVLALILTIGKRVFAFFIERGVEGDVTLPRAPKLAAASLVSFVAFVVVDLVWPASVAAGALAAAVALVNGRRLMLWAHPGVWRRSMLWVLVVGYGWIVVGFAMYGAACVGWLPPHLALHALTAGGIGLVTLGMMARVSLGHTGRNIYAHRPLVTWAIVAMAAAAAVRVVGPLVDVVPYVETVVASQALWSLSFTLFVWVYTPVLLMSRADGKPG